MTSAVVYPHAATIFASVCACIFAVVGTLGNLITILALLINKKLRSHATTAFVLSLCISDLLLCTISLPLMASRFIHEAWIFSDTLCKAFAFVLYSNEAVSLLSMVGITLNRFVLIACQEHYAKMYKPWSIALQLSVVWIFSISVMIPPLLGIWGKLGLKKSTFSCTILRVNDTSIKTFLFTFGFFIPCVFITICYSWIYWFVRKQRQNLDVHSTVAKKFTSSASSRRDREDSRLTVMMLTTFICFLVCFLPLMLVNATMEDEQYPWIQILGSVLAWSASVVNPFLYAVCNRTYSEAYYRLLTPLKFWGQPLSTKASKTYTPSKVSRVGSQKNTSESLHATKNKVQDLETQNEA